jgi:hypothetical protein
MCLPRSMRARLVLLLNLPRAIPSRKVIDLSAFASTILSGGIKSQNQRGATLFDYRIIYFEKIRVFKAGYQVACEYISME